MDSFKKEIIVVPMEIVKHGRKTLIYHQVTRNFFKEIKDILKYGNTLCFPAFSVFASVRERTEKAGLCARTHCDRKAKSSNPSDRVLVRRLGWVSEKD